MTGKKSGLRHIKACFFLSGVNIVLEELKWLEVREVTMKITFYAN